MALATSFAWAKDIQYHTNQAVGHCHLGERDPEVVEQGEIKMSAAAKTEDKFMF